MKMRIILQAFTLVALFFLSWFVLQKFNWMQIFRIEKLNDRSEEKIGDLFWEYFRKTEKEFFNNEVSRGLDSILIRICDANNIDRNLIKLHVLESEQVNAFALPNGHLVLFTGLIHEAENPEELCGVLCHEIAHIQLRHVMKKLVKELGLSVIISMTSGGSGGEVVRQAASVLSSSAFDRKQEKEADIKSVDYMAEAQVHYESFANFLYKLSTEEDEIMKYLSWISTHPDSKERAEYIIEYGKSKHFISKPLLSDSLWQGMKNRVMPEKLDQ